MLALRSALTQTIERDTSRGCRLYQRSSHDIQMFTSKPSTVTFCNHFVIHIRRSADTHNGEFQSKRHRILVRGPKRSRETNTVHKCCSKECVHTNDTVRVAMFSTCVGMSVRVYILTIFDDTYNTWKESWTDAARKDSASCVLHIELATLHSPSESKSLLKMKRTTT